MNLVLFEPGELDTPLPLADPRARHLLHVLRRAPGDTFVAGLVNGPRGIATLLAVDMLAATVTLAFSPTQVAPAPPPITLLVGLPRPQTARDILRDATTLGVACIHFLETERTDPNYAAASLWTSGEWRRHVLAGAAQACVTGLPEITWQHSLIPWLAASPMGPSAPPARRIALDNYEATMPFATALASRTSTAPTASASSWVLALGPERGWGPADRTALRTAGFTLCSLGERVLRLETAVVAALTLCHASDLAPGQTSAG